MRQLLITDTKTLAEREEMPLVDRIALIEKEVYILTHAMNVNVEQAHVLPDDIIDVAMDAGMQFDLTSNE